jgi:hypothetical protein
VQRFKGQRCKVELDSCKVFFDLVGFILNLNQNYKFYSQDGNPSPDGRENPRLFLARFGMTAGNSSKKKINKNRFLILKCKKLKSTIFYYLCNLKI